VPESRTEREERIRRGIENAARTVRESPLFQGKTDTERRERIADAVRRGERENPRSQDP
jgi:hypothetical protein